MKKQYKHLLLILAALIAAGTLAGCNGGRNGGGYEGVPGHEELHGGDVGQGETVFRFEATDNEGTVTAWNVHTDETTVGAALLEAGLIAGDRGAFGLFVTEVNGLRADFDGNGAWWKFYIGGEMAMTGVDAAEIDPEKTYAFVYTTE